MREYLAHALCGAPNLIQRNACRAPPPSPVRYIVGRASTPQTARPVIDLLTTSSSDSIENPDNDPAPTTPAYALKNAAASSKRSPRSDDIDVTPMPLRTLPTSFRPIGKTAKPGPAKKAAEPVVAVADDDEEGLEEFDLGAELVRSREQEERARKEQEKEEKRRKLAERKQAAIRASRSKAPAARATEDSDSDLDIEGAPSTKKGVRPSRRSRSPSAAADTLAQFASRKQSSPKRTAALNELLRFARASSEHPLSDDVEPSESQFKAAGKTFGANLDPNKRYLIGPKNRRQQAPVTVTQDINNEHLQRKMREQNAKERAKKQRNYRQMEQTRENEPKELESVNVDAMVKAKKEREEEDEKMEEEEDGDYVDEDDGGEEYNSADIGSDGDGEDDVGSESDVPVAQGRVAQPAPQNLDDDDLFDSEGEPVLPKSSQNDDRLGKAPDARDAFSDAEDEDDDSMLPPAFSRKARKAARIVDDEEEAQEEEDFAAVAAASGASLEAVTPKKTRVELGGLLGDVGGDDGGFSQFFNSQFSPGGDGASVSCRSPSLPASRIFHTDASQQVGGFLRRDDEVFEPPAPTMFAVQPLISTAERAKDAARLEARGGFNDLAPATPREVAAPRQYINEKGCVLERCHPSQSAALTLCCLQASHSDSSRRQLRFAFGHAAQVASSDLQHARLAIAGHGRDPTCVCANPDANHAACDRLSASERSASHRSALQSRERRRSGPYRSGCYGSCGHGGRSRDANRRDSAGRRHTGRVAGYSSFGSSNLSSRRTCQCL